TACRQARRQLVEVALGQLQAGCGEAVATLRAALASPHSPTRVRAAVAVLDRAVQAIESADLAADIEDVKRRLGEVEHGRTGTAETGPGPGESGPTPPGAADAPDAGGAGSAD